MLKDIVIAIQSYGQAHRFIRKHKLWKWIIIPGVIYMLLFCISMYFFANSASEVVEFLLIKTGLKGWITGMKSTLAEFLVTIGGIMLWLLLMLFYFSLFKFIWLIVGSPIFALLSEKTESLKEGKSYPFNIHQFIRDVVRGIGIALRNTVWQTVYILSLILLSFIPVIGWVVPVFGLLIECYYYGFSMLDYSCERHHLSAAESIQFIGQRKGLAIANGVIFYFLHLIPIAGWIVAPSYAVIAATLCILKTKEKETPTLEVPVF